MTESKGIRRGRDLYREKHPTHEDREKARADKAGQAKPNEEGVSAGRALFFRKGMRASLQVATGEEGAAV